MIKRLIFALTLLLMASNLSMAQEIIPIVALDIEHGQILYLPGEAAPGAWVDFVVRCDNGYEEDEICAYKIIESAQGTSQEPIEVENVNPSQYGFYMPIEPCIRVEVSATFKKIPYIVTFSDDIENGMVELIGENGIGFGETVQLKVTPNTDYLLNTLSVVNQATGKMLNTTLVSTEGNVSYFEFTMPMSDVVVNATFKPVPRYAISILDSENGSLLSDVPTARVGDTVTLTVNNDPGYMITEIGVVAGYPITSGSGGAHAPSLASAMWYQQQVIEVTKVDSKTYQFVLPESFTDLLTPNYQDDTEFRITATFQYMGPRVIWCEGNTTLYFDFDNDPDKDDLPQAGDEYNGQTITDIWYTNHALPHAGMPHWNSMGDQATTVVFTPDFAQALPETCYYWFRNFEQLETIEGMEYLNTSQVTSMQSMFENCWSLKTIDVNSFDMSNVTTTYRMFFDCFNLTTIYCDNTWNVATSNAMFAYDYELVGAVSYRSSMENDGTMANPTTGYFTGKWAVNISLSFEHGTVSSDKDWAYTNEIVTLTVTPDSGYKLETLTVTDANADVVEVVDNAFTMPASNVTVNATFIRLPGDLNGDGVVDVSDVNLLINVILGKAGIEDCVNTPDLNDDNRVDIADVNLLVNIILGR